MNSKNIGLVMTSLLSIRPRARTYVRTQSYKTNLPVFVWREVAWRDTFTTEMLMYAKSIDMYSLDMLTNVIRRDRERKTKKKNRKAETIKQRE